MDRSAWGPAAPAAPARPSTGPDRRAAPHAGDFVDRGAWGLEVLAVLAGWKLAAPGAVTLLRGNHESATCTAMYGFRAELAAKYGAVRARAAPAGARAHCAGSSLPPCGCQVCQMCRSRRLALAVIPVRVGIAVALLCRVSHAQHCSCVLSSGALEHPPDMGVLYPCECKHADGAAEQPCTQGMPAVYRAAKRAFAALPLAARVARAALVLHGGLFRQPPDARGGAHRRKRRRLPPDAPLALGTLADLRAASKARRAAQRPEPALSAATSASSRPAPLPPEACLVRVPWLTAGVGLPVLPCTTPPARTRQCSRAAPAARWVTPA